MILYPQFFNLSHMLQAKETTSEKCSPHRCGYKIMKRDNSQVFLLHCIVLGKTALMWWGSVLWKVKVARVCWVKWRRFVAASHNGQSWGGVGTSASNPPQKPLCCDNQVWTSSQWQLNEVQAKCWFAVPVDDSATMQVCVFCLIQRGLIYRFFFRGDFHPMGSNP